MITINDIVRVGFVADPDRPQIVCRGRNHADRGTLGSCGACGRQVVQRAGGKSGYAEPVTNEYGSVVFWCWGGSHDCDVERMAAHRRSVLVDLAMGTLRPRFPVKVVKGRKVPKGTTGVLTWIGQGDYGPRVGLRDADGATHWTAASNVEVHVEGELAAQVADTWARATARRALDQRAAQA